MECSIPFSSSRTHRGPLKAIILDWAGTTVDFGSFAPTAVILKLFENQGVRIRVEDARRPMGLMKKDHLRAIANMPEVAQAWAAAHGHAITEEELDGLFAQFVPMQLGCLEEYAQVIPGVIEAVAEFHRMDLKVGSTTGYTREIMEVLVPAAQRNGYTPDSWVSATDVPACRPFPWMVYQNAIQLQRCPLEAYVKIGDTLPDIEEGLDAGTWTIGMSITGNLLGLTEEEARALPADILQQKRSENAARLDDAGAHYVVDSLRACPPIIEENNNRLSRGERS